MVAIGSQALCSWNENYTELAVSLGSDASFSTDTTAIFLNPITIQGSNEELSGELRTLEVTLDRSDCPPPVLVVNGQSTYSIPCADSNLVLSSTVQSGTADNSVSYAWISDPVVTMDGVNTSSIAIPKGELSSGDYTFTAVVTNILGQQGSDAITVNVAQNQQLTLCFNLKSEITKTASSDMTVIATAINECNEYGGLISYQWSYQENGSEDLLPDPADLNVAHRKLSLKPNGLQTGSSYIYQLIASNGLLNVVGTVNVTVTSSPIRAIMNFGNQDISSEIDFLLDGSRSYDPDGDSLHFLWSCVDTNGSTCLSDASPVINQTEASAENSQYTLAADTLDEGDVLIVTLTVSTPDGRSDSASATLTVVNAGNTVARLAPLDVEKPSVSQRWLLSLDLENAESVAWAQDAGPTVSFPTGTNGPSLLIPANSMIPSTFYKFSALISNADGDTLNTYVEWTTNDSPVCSGELTVTQTDTFTYILSIDGCVDGDSPLNYLFSYIVRGKKFSGGSVRCNSSVTVFWMALPTEVSVEVCDSLDSCTTITKAFP